MAKLAPSLLSADFSALSKSVSLTEQAGADLLHIDVMDGHFVPNISFGAGVMKSLLGKTNLNFDVHLMIENPDVYIQDFVTDNTEFITVHWEACKHLNRTLQFIRSLGVKAGVALNPSTPLHVLDCVYEDLDLVLIMSVNPGFGGQKFITSALDKVKLLQRIKEEKGYTFEIEIDGGISHRNVGDVVSAGVEIVVAGSAVFGTEDVSLSTKNLISLIR